MHDAEPLAWSAARGLAERRGARTTERGERERAAWQASLGEDLLALRARSADLAPSALAGALSGAPPADDAPPPPWVRDVEAALSRTPAPATAAGGGSAVDVAASHVAGFFVAAIGEALGRHPHARPDAVALLADGAQRGLARACRRAVALEIGVTSAIEGWAEDEAKERSAVVAGALARPAAAREVLAANPALARMLADRTRLAIEAGEELLGRLHDDLPRVRAELLDGRPTDEIVAIDPLGDRHAGGRRVVRIAFASGDRVMLKPRSVVPDAAYYALLGELTALGWPLGFTTPRTLAVGTTHGWQEVVRPASCADAAGATRYFRRLGAQLAVLHGLRATDAHQENVVAAGEQPVLVDLETLLQPRMGGDAADVIDPPIGPAGTESVLRVGLLPHPDAAIGADLSGIGRDPDARAHVGAGGWAATAGEDGPLLAAGDNAARINGRPVRPQDHVDALASGFAEAYDLLLEHRDHLTRTGGALSALAGARVRVLLRPTQSYVFVLQQLTTRDACLGDGLARERTLNVLWSSARGRPDLLRAVEAERVDLWHGDVPRFEADPGGNDLHHHALGTLTGALGAQRCPTPATIHRLSRADRDRQLALLRTAVVATARAGHDPAGARAVVTPDAPRAAARAAADRLEVLALHDGDRAGWLTLADREPPREGAVLDTAGPGLVDGQAGIAWALRAAGRRRLADAAAARLAGQREGRDERDLDSDDAELVLALGGLGLGRGADAAALWSRGPILDAARPAWVLAGTALVRDAAVPLADVALAGCARRLAADGAGMPPALVAGALADASTVLGDAALMRAALEALRAADDGPTSAPARLLAALALHDAAPTAAARSVIAAALDDAAEAPSSSAAAAFATAATARAAEAILRTDAAAARATAVVRRVGDVPVSPRGLETPGLRDGHAGVIVGALALADGALPAATRAALLLAATGSRPVLRPPSSPTHALELARA
jgi:hypothetical protein